jgi:hypothetical protein
MSTFPEWEEDIPLSPPTTAVPDDKRLADFNIEEDAPEKVDAQSGVENSDLHSTACGGKHTKRNGHEEFEKVSPLSAKHEAVKSSSQHLLVNVGSNSSTTSTCNASNEKSTTANKIVQALYASEKGSDLLEKIRTSLQLTREELLHHIVSSERIADLLTAEENRDILVNDEWLEGGTDEEVESQTKLLLRSRDKELGRRDLELRRRAKVSFYTFRKWNMGAEILPKSLC